MMLPDVELQSSFLKDLVTSTNPTSPWSFVAYLVAPLRLFTFLNAQYDAVPRREFARYFEWVAGELPSLTFGTDVREISHDGHAFVVSTDMERHRARNIALGVGSSPFVPTWASSLKGDRCFHCSEATERLSTIKGDRIAVIGGGQSGGEIVQHLVVARPAAEGTEMDQPPASLRTDQRDTPFSNQVFSPEYVDAYRQLSDDRKLTALDPHPDQRRPVAVDHHWDLPPPLHSATYRRRRQRCRADAGNRDVIQVTGQQDGYRLIVRNGFDGGIEIVFADVLVLATGYTVRCRTPSRRCRTASVSIAADAWFWPSDYSAAWDGPRQNRIFALNVGRYSHGIADSS